MVLSSNQIRQALGDLDGWSYEDDSLVKTFHFPDFRAAVSFVIRVAFVAEELNHHPRIDNTYNRVTLSLSTHDAGNTVTQKDLTLATRIQEL